MPANPYAPQLASLTAGVPNAKRALADIFKRRVRQQQGLSNEVKRLYGSQYNALGTQMRNAGAAYDQAQAGGERLLAESGYQRGGQLQGDEGGFLRSLVGEGVEPYRAYTGQTLSAERTAAKGYRTAHVIRNGEIVDGLGGGVCQAGTTMFNAVFFAGLPVPERRNHSLHISHYPMGRDATLNWPGTDLKFRNDSPYGIYITGHATASTLTFTLWSTSRGYKVAFATSAASNFRAPPTRYEDDPTLPKGEEVVEESGASGFDVTVSRTVTNGGEVVRTDQFVSVYRPWTRVVRRGTKPKEAEPTAAGGSR